ncbi:MAG: hypothetical protein ACO271_09445, partial [Burkholderiales bacterium]
RGRGAGNPARRAGRSSTIFRPLGSDDDERVKNEIVDTLFAEDGHWRGVPADWGSPAKSL